MHKTDYITLDGDLNARAGNTPINNATEKCGELAIDSKLILLCIIF
jgi:hypothetical protein